MESERQPQQSVRPLTPSIGWEEPILTLNSSKEGAQSTFAIAMIRASPTSQPRHCTGLLKSCSQLAIPTTCLATSLPNGAVGKCPAVITPLHPVARPIGSFQHQKPSAESECRFFHARLGPAVMRNMPLQDRILYIGAREDYHRQLSPEETYAVASEGLGNSSSMDMTVSDAAERRTSHLHAQGRNMRG